MRHFNIKEVAELLNTTPKAVRNRIARGQIPFRKWGKRVLIPADELEKFLTRLPGRNAEEAVAAVEGR